MDEVHKVLKIDCRYDIGCMLDEDVVALPLFGPSAATLFR